MSSGTEPIYCGMGRVKEFDNGGKVLKLSFSERDRQLMDEHANEKGWVNLVVAKRREPSKTGVTHYCKIDTYQPKRNQAEPGTTDATTPDTDDLPF